MKVLAQNEAQALYEAMCCLNDIDAGFSFTVHNAFGDVTVKSDDGGWTVKVLLGDTLLTTFDNQAEFAQYHGASIE